VSNVNSEMASRIKNHSPQISQMSADQEQRGFTA
jgi:hypothetical protein